MLVRTAIILWTMVYISAATQCPKALFGHCNDNRHNISGYKCRSTADTSAPNSRDSIFHSHCKPDGSWCNAGSGTRWPHWTCPQYENYHTTSCFAWSFTLAFNGHRYDYLVLRLATSWLAAEIHCGELGYHLLSLTSQAEANELTNKLYYLNNNPTVWAERTAHLRDPMGLTCPNKRINTDDPSWQFSTYLGLYCHDAGVGWKYSDDKPLTTNITVGQRRTKLGKVLQEGVCDKGRQKVVWFTDYGKGAFETIKQSTIAAFGVEKGPTAIMCKREHPQVPSHPEQSNTAGCISGFRCPASNKCIIGVMFNNTQLCDGRLDCPGAEDESLDHCRFIKLLPERSDSVYIFSPILRPVVDIIEFCNSQNMTLPILRSEEDKNTLLSLPKMYASASSLPSWSVHQTVATFNDPDGAIPANFIQGDPDSHSPDSIDTLTAFSRITMLQRDGTSTVQRLTSDVIGYSVCQRSDSSELIYQSRTLYSILSALVLIRYYLLRVDS